MPHLMRMRRQEVLQSDRAGRLQHRKTESKENEMVMSRELSKYFLYRNHKMKFAFLFIKPKILLEGCLSQYTPFFLL